MTSIERILKSSLEKINKYDDRKSISEVLLISILHELSEINKKLGKPKVKKRKPRKKAKKK